MNKVQLFLPEETIEESAVEQIKNTASIPFLFKHIAVMPDCHFGMGSTVGTVIPTKGAVIPAAVGVDIGCGMIAVKTNLKREDIKDTKSIHAGIERRVPVSAGGYNKKITESAGQRIAELEEMAGDIDYKNYDGKWHYQMGSLGSGNHFIELSTDESDTVWAVLHSGSRGIGNKIAQAHIKIAKKLMEKWFIELPDPDLAFFPQSTPEFGAYINDLHWAQKFALLNREEMMDRVMAEVATAIFGNHKRANELEVERINCHHNFTQIEHHCSTCIDNLHNDNHLYERLLADERVSKVRDFLGGYRPFVHSCGGLLLTDGASSQSFSPSQADVLEQTHAVLRSLAPQFGQKHTHSLQTSGCVCASLNQIDEASHTSSSKFGLGFSHLFGVEKEYRTADRVLGHIFYGVGAYDLDHEMYKHLHSIHDVWITRKGAIEASKGKLAFIPGSMGTSSYVVEGKGNVLSFNSAPHGAGRRMSRTAARKKFTMEDFDNQIKGVEVRRDEAFIDELPGAYKDIDEVMENAKDLVEVKYKLKQFLNVKGK